MRYNLPHCEDCGIELKDKRSVWCKKHMNSHIPRTWSNKGTKWKFPMPQDERDRRRIASTGRKLSESAKQKVREWHIAHPNRNFKNTGIELKMAKFLDTLHISYVAQYPIKGIARVDFYVPLLNLVIQCDGCYWHNCPKHYPNHHIEQTAKDRKKDNFLLERGYKLVRFWEHEINTFNF